jgi:hypothetical protein
MNEGHLLALSMALECAVARSYAATATFLIDSEASTFKAFRMRSRPGICRWCACSPHAAPQPTATRAAARSSAWRPATAMLKADGVPHFAASKGYLGLIEVLLARGMDPRVPGTGGALPFMLLPAWYRRQRQCGGGHAPAGADGVERADRPALSYIKITSYCSWW